MSKHSPKYFRIKKRCLYCDKEFEVIPARENTAKFCSGKCRGSAIGFQKSNQYGKLLIGIKWTKEHRENMARAREGNGNGNWMGDDVNCSGVHAWIRRHKGMPKICEFCGSIENLDWANKDHSYKRKLDDYISLCRSCHMKYDIEKGQRINTILYSKS